MLCHHVYRTYTVAPCTDGDDVAGLADLCANAGYTKSEFQGPHAVTKRLIVTKLTSLIFVIVRLPFPAFGM